MKKLLLMLIALVCTATTVVKADMSYSPTPVDAFDLEHSYYYTWGVDLQFNTGEDNETIRGASLTFNNIRNYDILPNVLYIHLLDDAELGITEFRDRQGADDYYFQDAFADQGILIAEFTDDDDQPYTTQTVTYTFDEEQLAVLNDYAADGVVAFGFDPDCHFYNTGIDFNVAVPAPGAILLGTIGTAFVGFLRRKKSI